MDETTLFISSKSDLNVIIPFKSTSSDQLFESVCSILNQCYLSINVIIIYDASCSDLVATVVSECYKYSIPTDFHTIQSLPSSSKGIYSAINQGLSLLDYGSLYIVLGAGDTLKISADLDLNLFSDITYLPYRLSKNPKILYSIPRKLYTGMPYCHNAIVFKKNQLQYDVRYSISADYKYFIQYLRMLNVSLDTLPTLSSDLIKVTYDNISGVSKKLYILKNIQNMSILLSINPLALPTYLLNLMPKLFRRMMQNE